MSQATELIARQMAAGASIGKIWGTLIYNVKDSAYAAKGDGVIDDTTALTNTVAAASVNGGTVVFPPGTYKTGNFTVPSNVTLWFMNGAKLSINSGATVTINGPIEAGLYQIFIGLGLVRGLIKNDSIYPTWWGLSQAALDSQIPIQAAIDYIQATQGPICGNLVIPNGNYSLNGGITIKFGSSYTPVAIDGGNSAFYFSGTGACIQIQPTDIQGGPGGLSHFEIFDLQMNTTTLSGSTGLLIGISNYVLDDFSYSSVRNVMIQNFDIGIQCTESRHINFKDVVVRTPKTKALFIQALGHFCGDLNFDNCEFTSGTHSAVHLFSSSASVASEVRGHHFTNCFIYGKTGSTAAVVFESNGFARIFDVWFSMCALDQGQVDAFLFNIIDNSQMGNFQINQCYCVGFSKFINYLGGSTLDNYTILVQGNMVTADMPFNLLNAANIRLDGNTFSNVNVQSNLSGACKNIQIINNNFNNPTLDMFGLIILAATLKSAIIKNNFANFNTADTFVHNNTTLPATALIIADNLHTVN